MLITWLTGHSEAAIVLIPISTLGFIRFGVWILKRVLGLFYRPIHNSYDTTATIVTPVYQEDPRLFSQALDSWIVNKPDHIISVVDVTDMVCMKIADQYAARYPIVTVHPIDIPGKRPALAAGVDATTTDIVVLVDSDVVWDPDVLQKIKMPFADPRIGGVGTRQHMIPTDGKAPTFWERIADIYLDIRYCDEMPMTVAFGQDVSCLSGRTAAYRTGLLK
jgi:hyaluronan synthase